MQKSKLSPENCFLLNLLNNYNRRFRENLNLTDLNTQKLLDSAEKNDMLYYAATKLLSDYHEDLGVYKEIVEKIISDGNDSLKKFTNTLDWINDLKEFDFLIFKTYQNYTRIPNDIDIFVKDFKKALNVLVLKDAKIINLTAYDAFLIKKSMYPIHLHKKMAWAGGIDLFDIDILWNDLRRVHLDKTIIKIPNVNADFLIYVAHLLFEKLYFSLPELLYLFKVEKKLDFKITYSQAKKYNWSWGFLRIINLMDHFHRVIYNEHSPLSIKIGLQRSLNFSSIEFPVNVPLNYIVFSFVEKGLLIYPLLKIKRSRQVLSNLFGGRNE
jgi:hypothetical protein